VFVDQLKDMAGRLPVGAVRNIKSPTLASLGSDPANEVSNASVDQLNGQISQGPDSNGSNSQLLSNGSSTTGNRNSGHNKQGNSDLATRNGNKTKEGESCNDTEWVEQDEPGVYITLTALPGGVKELKRVRFRYVIHAYIRILTYTHLCADVYVQMYIHVCVCLYMQMLNINNIHFKRGLDLRTSIRLGWS
jgi:hypothetical protein